MQFIKQKHKIIVVILVLLLGVGVFVGTPEPEPAEAVTVESLRNKTEKLEAKIAENEKILKDLSNEVNTLENRLSQIRAQIDRAVNIIELTKVKIADLEKQIAETQKELDRQKAILAEALRELYKHGDITTIEMLAASEGYTDFINQQEYLGRLKQNIQESADKVEALKEQLDEEKKEQEKQLDKKRAQRKVLDIKREEQAQLLAETRGEEARYASIVADLEEQRRQAEQELLNFIANQNFVSQGPVLRGQKVGEMGSTGFSTGNHLHFAVLNGTTFINPVASEGTLINGYSWPLPNSTWGDVTQVFGCVAPYDWYHTKCDNGNSFHAGLDIAGYEGDPVVAAADGEIIFRGWIDGYGYTVIVDHGGVYTYYPHMLPF